MSFSSFARRRTCIHDKCEKNERDGNNEVVQKVKKRLINYQVEAEEMKEKKKPFFFVFGFLEIKMIEEPALSESG
jgi:hypothetical protein